MGVDIKIETNGSGGVKNHLTQADIDRAVGVIVACDKDVPVQRFAGKPVIFTKVANGIKIPEELIQTVAGLTGVTVDHYAEIGLLGIGRVSA